ncbi:FHF complex subunit HOOK interacting protein 2A-like isoform X2 [Styela clava]|uniref:protein FAM160B1-like isoform X2 n=1 Tax=Styela clava TaxID=7725 RepID=UPI00193AC990|nr:protein FAM160B1-like isoform X2 [Styela clava]
MFSKFSTILQQAVDALAPEATPIEDFVYHWKCITNFYVENTDEKCPVNSTNIPSHMQQMLVILVEEEAEREVGNTGPCMEYLLQHKLLETLHTLGRADCPPGMKQQVLRFFTSLLGRIQQPLLPHINVHRPVSRLVRVCGEVAAAPTESEEIAFLCTVCARLKQEPHLAHLFLRGKEDPKLKNKKKEDSPVVQGTSGNNADQEKPTTDPTGKVNTTPDKTASAPSTSTKDTKNSPSLHSYTTKREGYDLVDSLLNLTKSEDGRVAVKACEGIMLLVSLEHKDAARAIVQDTALCYLLNLRLSSLFAAIPENVDPVDIDAVEAKWGLDARTDDSHRFSGKRALISFLSWFDYCDRLISEGNSQECRELLAKSMKEQFFGLTLSPLLCATNEHTILTATSIFTKLFRSVECKELLREMLNFLLAVSNEESVPSLLLRILERCDHLSDEITIVSLQLFETVLRKNDPIAMDELVIKYLLQRGYHAENPGNIVIQTDAAELEWDLEPGLEVSAANSTETQRTGSQSEHDTQQAMNVAKFNPRLHVQQAVNCYLNVLPEAAKSSQTFDDDSGHDSYLREAHRMYRDVQYVCSQFNWPKEFDNPDRCPAVNNFNEGPFLRMLLSKISRILDQPYEVNLVVTSIASRLCLMPHPLLHEYFVDPLTPLRPNVKTLYNTIQHIITEMMARFARFPNFKHKLLLARKSLIGNNESPIKTLSSSPPPHTVKGGHEHSFLLEGSIVLEEFCKELSAILFVKHHASSATT